LKSILTAQAPSSSLSVKSYRQLSVIFWLAAATLGIGQAWAGRQVMNPDGIAYLDMGGAYLRGDWATAINAQWSPFYSWILGLAVTLASPAPGWEFPLVHFVNFGIFLCSAACFEFFLREMVSYHRKRQETEPGGERAALPERWLIALSYTLFAWSSLVLIGMSEVSPDLLVSAFIYLASGLVLRIRRGRATLATFALFGLVLGLAYLAKAPMLPLAFVFFGVAMFSTGNVRRAWPRVLVAMLAFLLVSAPFIFALSSAKGRLTFGDSGMLNYAWYINGTTRFVHWQGEDPASGTPYHSTRKILDTPAIYEFASPFRTSYPPWYDPSYWYEGVTPRFDLKGQIKVLASMIGTWWGIFFNLQRGFPLIFLILLYASCDRWSRLKEMARHWELLVPALAVFAMFSLVNLESRYVGPFVALFWIGLLFALKMPDRDKSPRLVSGVAVAMIAALTLATAISLGRQFPDGREAGSKAQWEVASELHRVGVGDGDAVASIGDSFRAYWARLARVRIVAEIAARGPLDEITAGDTAAFWKADRYVRALAYEAFARTGAKVIVTDELPKDADHDGWQRLGGTSYYFYPLHKMEQTADEH
jgi:hypothetical protein